MKRFRCAREFIEQYLNNKLNDFSFELFATGIWETEYSDEEQTEIFKYYLDKLSQLGKRGKNKIFDIDNLCMKLNEKKINNKSVFSIVFTEPETRDPVLMFMFYHDCVGVINFKTSLPFNEKYFNSWDEVKLLFN